MADPFADDTNCEFGRMINIVEAAELLDLVDTPKRLVVLEPDGVRLVRAAPEEQKAIWKAQLLKLNLFRLVYDVLQRQPGHEVDRLVVAFPWRMRGRAEALALAPFAVERFGALHILVNNAGARVYGPVTEATEESCHLKP